MRRALTREQAQSITAFEPATWRSNQSPIAFEPGRCHYGDDWGKSQFGGFFHKSRSPFERSTSHEQVSAAFSRGPAFAAGGGLFDTRAFVGWNGRSGAGGASARGPGTIVRHCAQSQRAS